MGGLLTAPRRRNHPAWRLLRMAEPSALAVKHMVWYSDVDTDYPVSKT